MPAPQTSAAANTPAATSESPGLLLSIWHFFWDSIVRVLWLCGYATLTAIGTAVLFLRVGQGQDLLRLSAEKGFSLWNLAFLLSALALGFSLWYSARLLLSRTFAADAVDPDRSQWGRIWLPRAYGTAIPLAIGIGFLRVDTGAQFGAWVLGVLFVLCAAALLWFFYRRRAWFMDAQTQAQGLTAPNTPRDRTGMIAILSLALVVNALLMVAFITWPVTLPQSVGTPAIVLLGFTGIALFGSLILTYAFLVNGLPAGTALALVLAAAFGFINDNHWIRLAPPAPALARQGPAAHFEAWRATKPPVTAPPGRTPVILVAASGGGIRAAYWTASTLATLEEKVPGFSQALFSVSGVSGGSVGATVYTAIKRRQLETATPAAGQTTLEEVKQALSQDFLSPVMAGFMFPDLVQRFLPWPVPEADRQRFLELSFEHALGGGDNPLTRPFTALYADGYALRLPSLLLNTTVVDSGQRAVVSNIALDHFTDTLDLLGKEFQTKDIRLSAAAGASARFTYVSPAGSLLIDPGTAAERKMRVVDGGYFENSGAATLSDLLHQLPAAEIYPILILIRNDPQAPAVCHDRVTVATLGTGPAGPPADDFLSELASPVRALLNARTARGRLAEVDAAKQVEHDLQGAVIEVSLAAVMQAELTAAAGDQARRQRIKRALVEPPLGWSLSSAVRDAMDKTMANGGGGLDAEFKNLAAALSGGTVTPCNAQ